MLCVMVNWLGSVHFECRSVPTDKVDVDERDVTACVLAQQMVESGPAFRDGCTQPDGLKMMMGRRKKTPGVLFLFR